MAHERVSTIEDNLEFNPSPITQLALVAVQATIPIVQQYCDGTLIAEILDQKDGKSPGYNFDQEAQHAGLDTIRQQLKISSTNIRLLVDAEESRQGLIEMGSEGNLFYVFFDPVDGSTHLARNDLKYVSSQITIVSEDGKEATVVIYGYDKQDLLVGQWKQNDSSDVIWISCGNKPDSEQLKNFSKRNPSYCDYPYYEPSQVATLPRRVHDYEGSRLESNLGENDYYPWLSGKAWIDACRHGGIYPTDLSKGQFPHDAASGLAFWMLGGVLKDDHSINMDPSYFIAHIKMLVKKGISFADQSSRIKFASGDTEETVDWIMNLARPSNYDDLWSEGLLYSI